MLFWSDVFAHEGHVMAKLLSILMILGAMVACEAEMPNAIAYEVDHQRAVAAGHYVHRAGYAEYRKFTEANSEH